MLRVNIKPCMSKVIPMLTDNHEYAFFDDPLDHSLGNPLCYQSDSPMDHNKVTHDKVLLIDNISLMRNKRPHVSLSLLLSSSRSTKWHHFGAILKFRHLSLMSSDVERGPKHARDTFYSKRRTTDKFQLNRKQKVPCHSMTHSVVNGMLKRVGHPQ